MFFFYVTVESVFVLFALGGTAILRRMSPATQLWETLRVLLPNLRDRRGKTNEAFSKNNIAYTVVPHSIIPSSTFANPPSPLPPQSITLTLAPLCRKCAWSVFFSRPVTLMSTV